MGALLYVLACCPNCADIFYSMWCAILRKPKTSRDKQQIRRRQVKSKSKVCSQYESHNVLLVCLYSVCVCDCYSQCAMHCSLFQKHLHESVLFNNILFAIHSECVCFATQSLFVERITALWRDNKLMCKQCTFEQTQNGKPFRSS